MKFLAPLALAAVVALAPAASAQAHPGPIHCNAVRCVQYRVVQKPHHVSVTSKRTAPVESRTAARLHWSPWVVVAVGHGVS